VNLLKSSALTLPLLMALSAPISAQQSWSEVAPGSQLPPREALPLGPPAAPQGGLTFFNDRVLFVATGATLVQENFDGSLVAPNNVCANTPALNSTTNDTCFATGGVVAGQELDVIVDGGGGNYVILTTGFLGVTADVVGPSSFTDHAVWRFDPPVTAVGFDVVGDLIAAVNVDINIFDVGGNMLGTTTSAGTNPGTFFGVTSTTPIGRIETVEPAGGGELFSGLVFGDLILDADVGVTKVVSTAPSPLLVGSSVVYTISASNAGPADGTDVVVSDTLPANLTYVSNTCGATFAAPTLTWTIGALASGASVDCSITTTVADFGEISNTATIAASSTDPNAANNAATAVLAGVPFPADVAIALSSDATLGALSIGTQFNYTIDATNAGPGVANDLAFVLQLSGKVSFVTSSCGAVAAGSSVTWSVPTLAIGAAFSCVVTVSVVAPGDLLATASVSTSTVDPNLVNNSADLVVGFVATAVPTLSQLGLLLLGLVLAGFAVVIIRR